MARGGEAGPVYFSFLWTGQHLGESEISGLLLPLLPGSGLGRGPQMWLCLRGGAGSLEGGRLAATAAALITFSPDLISH